MNVALPVGIAEPAAAATVAVKVSACPLETDVAELVKVVVVCAAAVAALN
jgi:hypothetical protein